MSSEHAIDRLVDDCMFKGRDVLEIVAELNTITEPTKRRMAYYALREGIRTEVLSLAHPKLVRGLEIRHGKKLIA